MVTDVIYFEKTRFSYVIFNYDKWINKYNYFYHKDYKNNYLLYCNFVNFELLNKNHL